MLDNQQQLDNAIIRVNEIDTLATELFEMNKNAFEGNKELSKGFSNFFQIPVDYLLGKCACTKEYSRLSDKFCDNTTFGDIVNRLDELSLKDRQHILYLLKIMKRASEK